MTEQPNILVILSDQHGAQWSAPYGHPIIQTPNMDRLAAQGTVFDNAYCNSPICVPSRMSFMTGLHVRHTKVWDNGVPLPSDVPTWAHLARTAGYDVVLSGKMHFRGLDELHGFRKQLAYDINAQNLPNIPDWSQPLPQKPPVTKIKAEIGRSKEVIADDAVTAAALSYIKEDARQKHPWAMVTGYVAPHPPFVVPQEYAEMYPPEEMDLPHIPNGHLEQLHASHQRMVKWRGQTAGGISEANIRRARSIYYGLITYLDDQIGQLLAALEETNQLENTIIIYMSDHGEMLGEHGIWAKSNFYEQSAHVPLIISGPGLPQNQRISQNVSTVDVTATLLEIMNAQPIHPIDGNSLLPLMHDNGDDWKDEALSEYYADGSTRPWAMLKQEAYKLVYSHNEPMELYNLDDDPGEFNNLARDEAYGATRDRLAARLFEYINPAALDRTIRISQQERRLIYNDLFHYLLDK